MFAFIAKAAVAAIATSVATKAAKAAARNISQEFAPEIKEAKLRAAAARKRAAIDAAMDEGYTPEFITSFRKEAEKVAKTWPNKSASALYLDKASGELVSLHAFESHGSWTLLRNGRVQPTGELVAPMGDVMRYLISGPDCSWLELYNVKSEDALVRDSNRMAKEAIHGKPDIQLFHSIDTLVSMEESIRQREADKAAYAAKMAELDEQQAK
jgi:hypothetical protein